MATVTIESVIASFNLLGGRLKFEMTSKRDIEVNPGEVVYRGTDLVGLGIGVSQQGDVVKVGKLYPGTNGLFNVADVSTLTQIGQVAEVGPRRVTLNSLDVNRTFLVKSNG